MVGYILIASALVVFVQCSRVYPELLLARLLFSLGGAAVSTMVTAVLPTISHVHSSDKAGGAIDAHGHEENGNNNARAGSNAYEDESVHTPSVSISSELTITPALYQSHNAPPAAVAVAGSPPTPDLAAESSKIAGYVGMFAGCGALLSLVLFLPLPERLQKHGYSPELSLQYSYYIVAVVALSVAAWCAIGLHGLQGDPVGSTRRDRIRRTPSVLLSNFQKAISLGFRRADVGLGYVGGFVARASSVGISLFVPLLVNALFRSSGLCGPGDGHQVDGLPDLKRACSRAYIVAAGLTGLSQLVALLSAPVFGYASAKLGRRQSPLMFASVAGIVGYILLATRFQIRPDHQKGNVEAYLAMCLIGISQIGAIVCSLGVLSGGILKQHTRGIASGPSSRGSGPPLIDQRDQNRAVEGAPLLPKAERNVSKDLTDLKGSIAGIYSFYGGTGILVLTKLGGLLFDRVSTGAPFYIMAIFNGALLVVCILVATSASPGSKDVI